MIHCGIIGIPCHTKADALRWRFVLKVLSDPHSKEGRILTLLGKPYLDRQPSKQEFAQLIDRARKYRLADTEKT